MKKEDEKSYLYYLLAIGTMPRISVSKHEIRSKIDRTVVYKICEVIKKLPIEELDKAFETPRDGNRRETIEAFTLDRNKIENYMIKLIHIIWKKELKRLKVLKNYWWNLKKIKIQIEKLKYTEITDGKNINMSIDYARH